MQDGAQVQAITTGTGKGGNLTVDASDSVEVTNTTANSQGSRLAASTEGIGNAGNLTINTKRLVVTNAQVSASTFDKGDAGNLTVNASESVELSGKEIIQGITNPAGLFAQVNITGEGRGGNLTIQTERLSVSNEAGVQVATYGKGDAGNLSIRASDIDVFETSLASSFPASIIGGAQIDSDETKILPEGNGGNVEIVTNRLRLRDGGRISVTTEGKGNAGILQIRATESVEVFGTSPNGQFQSEISAATTPQSTGNGGSVSIDTGKLIIRDKGRVTVQNRSNGQAGNLEVNARSINLNQGDLSATTNSGNGGNITLTLQDLLLLRNNSTISTTAGTAQQGGDGGNITITSPFIVAVPSENSDISANAYTGKGGNISISTQGIFGIAARQQETTFSDITAISQLGIQGQINIIQPDIQPTQGLIELPNQVIDASNQIAQDCPRGRNAKKPLGEFIVTGRAIPPNATQPLIGTPNLTQLATLDSDHPKPNISSTPNLPPTSQNTIIEAQGWVKTPDGKIMLVAQAPEVTPNATTTSAACPVYR